jgi:hypothetical protein
MQFLMASMSILAILSSQIASWTFLVMDGLGHYIFPISTRAVEEPRFLGNR